ncbi:Ger(x)C family spore germination protein [Paenibacillus cremeus]|uniref:Ger(X)C family spore germination protein n=1 Tax=Paenibacillus cremeus TaxID=2163881 RepID=A0A559JGL7_9BACL|nr:Ger(x)C family spore germination protein [Paenibacillus cremeus]TVX99016.1 Ger(x)C family spore germination protein [Paenibacillus cremeus]
MRSRNPLKYVLLYLSLVLIATLLNGCWDRREIEERALVLGIGIDTAKPAETQSNKDQSTLLGNAPLTSTGLLHVTVQIAVPGRIPLGPGEGGTGGGGGTKTVWVLDAEGHTVEDALNNIQQKVAHPLFFGHLRVIVLSEAIAKKGVDNINEYFRRNPEVRRMNWMFVCKNRAEDIMRVSPELERVPTIYLLNIMDESLRMGKFPNDFIGLFWSASSSKGQEGILPYIELSPGSTINLSGLAYFRSEHLVGTTNSLEITLFMGIRGIHQAGAQAYVKIPQTSEYIMFGTKYRNSHIKVIMVNGKPEIRVKIALEGNILEKSTDKFTLNDDLIKKFEQQLKEDAQKSYEELIKKTQQKQSDIFGFGEYVRAKEPAYWDREIKTKEAWQKEYQNLSVQMEVKVHIRRVGMKSQ